MYAALRCKAAYTSVCGLTATATTPTRVCGLTLREYSCMRPYGIRVRKAAYTRVCGLTLLLLLVYAALRYANTVTAVHKRHQLTAVA